MTTIEQTTTLLWRATDETSFDEAQLAAAAFLARYSGRTLDAYRHDLRAFFQWASDNQLLILNATRPHVELYLAAMEDRCLAPSTVDRRLSTVCGFYRFAQIDRRIPSNPAQYMRRPKVQPSEGHGMDRSELGTFLFTAERFDRDHAALAVLLEPGQRRAALKQSCWSVHQRRRRS
jgi:site-specific recombinase XerD